MITLLALFIRVFCRFKVPEGCTSELSAQAMQFLTSLFERADVVRVYFVIGLCYRHFSILEAIKSRFYCRRARVIHSCMYMYITQWCTCAVLAKSQELAARLCSVEPRRASVAARARCALERVSGNGRRRRRGRLGGGIAQAAHVGHVAHFARGTWPRPARRHSGEPRRRRCCAFGRTRRRRRDRRRAYQRPRAPVPRRRQPLRPPASPRVPSLLGVRTASLRRDCYSSQSRSSSYRLFIQQDQFLLSSPEIIVKLWNQFNLLI